MKRHFNWKAQGTFDRYRSRDLPLLTHLPQFPEITNAQRRLLFNLVDLTVNESAHDEFWWCTHFRDKETGKLNQVTPIEGLLCGRKIVRDDGTFNYDEFVEKKWILRVEGFPGRGPNAGDWTILSERSNLKALEDAGYVTVSSIEEKIITDQVEETWRLVSVTQKAYKLRKFVDLPLAIRGIKYIWSKAENHILSFVFGILGAIAVQILLALLGR